MTFIYGKLRNRNDNREDAMAKRSEVRIKKFQEIDTFCIRMGKERKPRTI